MNITVSIEPVDLYRTVIFAADAFNEEQLSAMYTAIGNELQRIAKGHEEDRLSDLGKEMARRS